MNMSLTLSGFTPTTQALLLAVLVGGALLVLVGLSINNPLLWRMGVRNILRHRAQTLIMLCGLMLFSAFLTASFGLQDSFSHSVVVDRLTKVGDVDESVTGPFTQGQVESALTQIRQQAAVQAATAVYFNPLGANFHAQRTGITRTNQYILAAPPDFDRVYGALSDNQGQAITITDLRPGEVLLSRSVAKSFNIKPGDQIQITFHGQGSTLNAMVRAILSTDLAVTDGELAFNGTYPEIILPLTTFQQFSVQSLHQALIPNVICIKNVEPGKSQAVLSFLEVFFHTSRDTHFALPTYGDQITIHPLKPTAVEETRWNPLAGKGDFLATSAARQIDLLLPVFTGLLISAGLLLLILLCLLLAADRRVEMGMARAVGLQRRHLVQTLLIECCGYSLLAAVPGVLLGIGVLELELLMLSHVPSLSFDSGSEMPLHLWINWQSMLSVLCIGILTTFLVTGSTSIWISFSNIVTAIRNLDDLPSKANLKVLLDEWKTAPTMARRGVVSLRLLWAFFVRGPLCLLAGYLALRLGQNLNAGWLVQSGVAIMIAGAGLLLIWLSAALRLPTSLGRWLGGTLIGVGWLVYGLQTGAETILFVFTSVEPSADQSDLQAIALNLLPSLLLPLIGLVVLVMMNSEGLAIALHLVLRHVRGLVPISRISLVYPLTFRFRTGVAVSLLSLVLFLVMLIITNNLGISQQVAGTAQSSEAKIIATQNAYTASITRFLVAYLFNCSIVRSEDYRHSKCLYSEHHAISGCIPVHRHLL